MLIVTGTGRSGTSLIALWLQKCGVLEYEANWIEQWNAGLEPTDVSRVNGAIWIGNDPAYQSIPAQTEAIKAFEYKIIKDPKFFYGNVLNTWLSVRKDMKFLICLRKFSAVYKSRLSAKQLAMARKPEELENDLGRFVSQLVFNQIPFEFVCFPEFLDEYDTIYKKLKSLQPDLDINYHTGKKIWNSLVDKSNVHF